MRISVRIQRFTNALLILFLMSLPALGLAVEDGVYTGITSQGRAISFTVSSDVITEYSINFSCGATLTTETNLNCTIEGDGSFTCGNASCPTANLAPNIQLSGTFSGDSVWGSFDLAVRPCHPLDICGCCYISDGTFNASLPSTEPQISIGDVVVTEGDSGTTSAQFDVTMSYSVNEVVTVDWETANGTADTSDYTPASGTVTFNSQQTAKTVNVAVYGDADEETDEDFYVDLSNPVNAQIDDGRGQCTITDDDERVIDLLYSQVDNMGSGKVAQDFETSNDAFDSEIADDFTVPAAGWLINRAVLWGFYSEDGGPAESVNLWFYPDQSGWPGDTAVCSYDGVVPTLNTAGSLTSGIIIVDLPTGCVLSPGSYWLAAQVRMDYTPYGYAYLIRRTPQSGNEAVWRNPGDGFESGAVEWTRITGTSSYTEPDMIFSLLGEEGSIPSADLEISTIDVDPNPAYLDQSFTLTATVNNVGTGSATNRLIEYYMSTDNVITGADCYLGSDTVTLAAGTGGSETITMSPLSSAGCVSPGTYYIGISIPAETENWVSSGSVEVLEGGTPDIRIEPLALDFVEQTFLQAENGISSGGLDNPGSIRDLNIYMQNGTVSAGQAAIGVSEPLSKSALLPLGHRIIQFSEIPTNENRRELKELGVDLLQYLPNNAFWASIDRPVELSSVEKLSGEVLWIWQPDVSFKLSREIRSGNFPAHAEKPDGTVEVQVLIFDDLSHSGFTTLIDSIDQVELIGWTSPSIARLQLSYPLIETVAALDQVHWLEPKRRDNVPTNATSAIRIGVDTIQDAPYGLTGLGVTVGVWDAGSVDPHTDFDSRLTVQDAVAPHYHSTHVAGTVGGNGSGDITAMGMAPSAKIDSYDWTDDFNELRAASVDLSNHSYGWDPGWQWQDGVWVDIGGASVFGEYNSTSAEMDDIIADTNVIVFKGAGNDRNDGPDCPDGPRCDGPYDSISGATLSKNLITVCATDASDGMSTFSGWGPADDGRIKPDLCADGVNIHSTCLDDTYCDLQGTSMSGPAAAGAGALLFEHFFEKTGSNPAAHTLKALMIHGANDLGRTGPDYEFGWGLIDAQTTADLISNGDYLVSEVANTGSSRSYSLSVPPGSGELKATLVWTDPAGSPAAANAIINDLDLVLIAPGETQHFPWKLNVGAPGADATTGVNLVDNVEQVLVASPVAGEWIVQVTGTTIPTGPQEFALVFSGHSGAPLDSFTIYNDGDADLSVTGISPETSASWISWLPQAPFNVSPGASQAVVVSIDFSLAPDGQSTRRLLVESDDSDESPYPGGVSINVESESCYTLTRSHTGSGSDPTALPANSAGCSNGQYHAGELINLTASAAAGWSVVNWTGTDNDGSNSVNNSVTMPASARTVTVHYINDGQNCYLLTREHTGQGSDPSASPLNSQSCPAGEYIAGETISLTASPGVGWSVGSWTGTDNDGSTLISNAVTMPASIRTVIVNYLDGGNCSALRGLPAGYAPDQAFTVTVEVTPDGLVQVYAVEDNPPVDWPVSDISDEGSFDAINDSVKWGPFFDNQARSLSYSVTPPTDSTGAYIFDGIASFDGFGEQICGDSEIEPGTVHPADMNDSWSMTINEVTAYGAAWKIGDIWPRPPNPIDINYVTNCGFLWKNGEAYYFDAGQNPPWVPGAPPGLAVSGVIGGTGISSFTPSEYTPEQPVQVNISVAPDSGVSNYAAEDAVPPGWVVTAISDSGVFDSVNGAVKWGPFFDDSIRELSYTVTPPGDASGSKTFSGQVSFDGLGVAITGDREIEGPEELPIFKDGFE